MTIEGCLLCCKRAFKSISSHSERLNADSYHRPVHAYAPLGCEATPAADQQILTLRFTSREEVTDAYQGALVR
jgi:hypothetical protein